MRIFIIITLMSLAATAFAEKYEVAVDIPRVFAVTITEAEGTTYTMVLKAVDGGTTTSVTGVVSEDGDVVLVKRNLPVTGLLFTYEVWKDGVIDKKPNDKYALFDAMGIYPDRFLEALEIETTLAGYTKARKQATRSLLIDTAVRLKLAEQDTEVRDEEIRLARKRKALTGEGQGQ